MGFSCQEVARFSSEPAYATGRPAECCGTTTLRKKIRFSEIQGVFVGTFTPPHLNAPSEMPTFGSSTDTSLSPMSTFAVGLSKSQRHKTPSKLQITKT